MPFSPAYFLLLLLPVTVINTRRANPRRLTCPSRFRGGFSALHCEYKIFELLPRNLRRIVAQNRKCFYTIKAPVGALLNVMKMIQHFRTDSLKLSVGSNFARCKSAAAVSHTMRIRAKIIFTARLPDAKVMRLLLRDEGTSEDELAQCVTKTIHFKVDSLKLSINPNVLPMQRFHNTCQTYLTRRFESPCYRHFLCSPFTLTFP